MRTEHPSFDPAVDPDEISARLPDQIARARRVAAHYREALEESAIEVAAVQPDAPGPHARPVRREADPADQTS
jgi:hypothetical protein